MIENLSLSRRGFLKSTGLAATGLVIGCTLPSIGSSKASVPDGTRLNTFIEITTDGVVHFAMPHAEMGQGVFMGLTTLVAEEMDMNPLSIKTHIADGHPDFGRESDGVQGTGGSDSIHSRYDQLRKVGAQAREILLIAASQQLGVPKSDLRLKEGKIIHGAKQFSIGDFVETAKNIAPVDDAPLTPVDQFKWIGKARTPRSDAIAKVTGTAEFGIDVDVPGALIAAVKLCPVINGTYKSHTNAGAGSLPGVRKIVPFSKGVAVLADTYWQARQAVSVLEVQWSLPEHANVSNDGIRTQLEAGLSEEGEEASSQGNAPDVLGKSTDLVTARYYVPYLAHATMEPMNCTVQVREDGVELWVPNQTPTGIADAIAEMTGFSRSKILVHSTFLGGGFGRRVMSDYAEYATEIAMNSGETVKMIWSREDDTTHDYYRPVSMADFSASLTPTGEIEALSIKRAGPNAFASVASEILSAALPEFLPRGMVNWLESKVPSIMDGLIVDPSSVEGLGDDYDIANKEVRHVTVDPGIRTGFWRSVGHSFTGFFQESFMDELAHKAGKDPVEFRLAHLSGNPRLKRTLELAAEKAGWGKAKPGRYLGVASHYSFKSYVSEVAEISFDDGDLRIHKVTCVVDCGIAVNPDIVKAQMESGIIFGLTAALYGDITIENGVVQEKNFDAYQMLRMEESPEIEVHIINSTEYPTGVGEPGTPPIAPAVANAYFAATGTRLRSLPFDL